MAISGVNVARMKAKARRPLLPILLALHGCGHSGLPCTPLFVGVEGTGYAHGTRLIQDRLQSHFSNGSSDEKLAIYLERQGLVVSRSKDFLMEKIGVASFKYGGFVCGGQVRVDWKSDAAHSVQRIYALYGNSGCP